MAWLRMALLILRNVFRDRGELALENLALRQQLAVFHAKKKRPRIRQLDRIFWVWLSRFWSNWRSALLIVQPDTVVRWHQQGFRLYWRWKSRKKTVGRSKVDAETRNLIRRMCRENPSWGAPRIYSELQLLGFDVSETTVDKYLIWHRKPPSQTWRTFLDNHLADIVGVDFFTMPTATFRILFTFIILRHDRRRVVHFNVTAHPTAEWTAQQVVEAFPDEEAPRFLIRDRDGIYGQFFQQRVANMGIEEVVCSPRSPWLNPYAERIIGSIKRECLRHVIVLNERHLKRILRSYLAYYHEDRTHLSLDRNSPTPRKIEPREQGEVISMPRVGGLHHRYLRAA
ncbi:MAG: transposase [Planctomycetes bacterium]|nr:transposase [Planctomycetota bacterium]